MRTLLLLLMMTAAASAQNVAIRWTGSNTNGTPEFWPIIVQQIGTNTTLAGCIVLTRDQLDTVIRTNTPAFVAAQESAITISKAKAQAFIDALQTSMQQAADSVALIDGGTLTTAQRNAEFTRLKGYLADVRTRLNKIIAVSEKLLDTDFDR